MDEQAFFIHVGRLHIKICGDTKFLIDIIDNFEELRHTNEFKQYILTQYDKYNKFNPFSKEWAKQTQSAIEDCDYIVSLGNKSDPLVPKDWHLRFGEEEKLPDSPYLIINSNNLEN